MKSTAIVILVFLTGCSTISNEPIYGTPQISWILKDTNGCKDRIGLWRGKLVYKRCFW